MKINMNTYQHQWTPGPTKITTDAINSCRSTQLMKLIIHIVLWILKVVIYYTWYIIFVGCVSKCQRPTVTDQCRITEINDTKGQPHISNTHEIHPPEDLPKISPWRSTQTNETNYYYRYLMYSKLLYYIWYVIFVGCLKMPDLTSQINITSLRSMTHKLNLKYQLLIWSTPEDLPRSTPEDPPKLMKLIIIIVIYIYVFEILYLLGVSQNAWDQTSTINDTSLRSMTHKPNHGLWCLVV